MPTHRVAIFSCVLLSGCWPAFGQAEYRVYEEHPRLFLDPARLERLRKDVERQSIRWQSLRNLADEGEAFPEQPLVDALRFQVAGVDESGTNAVAWAKGLVTDGIRNGFELRQAALVYDWCYDLFDDRARTALRDTIVAAVDPLLPRANLDPGLLRGAILASIALAGDWPDSESILAGLLETHWRGEIEPIFESGGLSDDAATLIAILETSLAVRRNLEIDLLRPVTKALVSLVRARLLSYYPLDIETAEGLARRPSVFGTDDGTAAVQAPLYRIADMLLVAYEANLPEFQFLQGWIRDDAYLLRSPMAAPYELLWVNPYLPGLTPQSAPMLAYDPVRGRLYGRLGWERTATWVGYTAGRLEILANGALSASDDFRGLAPMYFPEAVIVPVEPPAKLVLSWQPDRQQAPESASVFFVGLQPSARYALKVGGRDAQLIDTDRGGVALLRTSRESSKRYRVDLRKKVRIELRPSLKPTDPGRRRPTLRP